MTNADDNDAEAPPVLHAHADHGDRYVCGFLFDSHRRVLLVRKMRGPAAVVGRWNGIGGRIERGEMGLDAMRREFVEETGIGIERWDGVLQLSGMNAGRFWSVQFYRAWVEEMPAALRSTNDVGEELGAFDVDAVLAQAHGRGLTYETSTRPGGVVRNLQWIVPMLLDGDVRKAMVMEVAR